MARNLAFAGVNWDLSVSVLNILDRKNLYVNTASANPSRYLAEGRELFGRATVRY